jgi:ABC-type sugar transport system permease subunit
MPSLAFISAPVVLAVYYAVLVAAKPRVPQVGSIVVRYEAPQDLTPAAARYVWKGCVDQRTVACVLAGLATKGRITLDRIQGGYDIRKTAPPQSSDALNAEEQSTMEWLFSNFLDSKIFHPQQDSAGCISSLRGFLDRKLGHAYQNTRYGWAALGMLASFAVSMMLALYLDRNGGVTVKFAMAFFLTTFMTGVVTSALLVPAFVDLARGTGSFTRLLFASVITAFPVAAAVGVAIQLLSVAPAELAIMIFVLVAINMIAVPLLRSVTDKGIEARRQIEGFREYLLKVEQDHLDRTAKLDTPPLSSDAMLSYAIALEVKEAWGDDLVNACFGG